MAELAAILPVVSRSSSLALELYRVAASTQDVAGDYIKVAKTINGFASITKQVGALITEDDRLPSYEAHEILENVMEQSGSVFTEIESITSARNGSKNGSRYDRNGQARRNSVVWPRLEYLTAHLETLRTTLSVLLQTLYTAQSIMWSKLRPTVSPQQAARAVANEKMQLETLIIEQQISILVASKLYEQAPSPDDRMLMESDSSQSLAAIGRGSTIPNPSYLHRYHDTYLASLNIAGSVEDGYLPAACSISAPRVESLLERWTSLPQFDNRIRDAEREIRMQQRESQQPTVESDSDEEHHHRKSKSKRHQRPDYVQPLFSDTATTPIPVAESRPKPAVPVSHTSSPRTSPRSSRNNFPVPNAEQYTPNSARSSVSGLPVEAAAAIEANEENSDVDLEIPWTLCTRKYYWKYIDAKMISSNTDLPPSTALSSRHPWTEIMASWVCKEAIREAGYRVTQVQKERREGKRTKLEPCFCIEQPLKFEHVMQLVERTVEIYRSTQEPQPQLQSRPTPIRNTTHPPLPSSSVDRPPPPPPPPNAQRTSEIDRDRTPRPHAQLERSTTSIPYASFPPPPPLDRSLSTPGSKPFPPPPPPPTNEQNPYLLPAGSYPPHRPQPASTPQQPAYPPPPHRQTFPQYPNPVPQSPLRQSYMNTHPSSRYDTDLTTSESDSGERERARRRRSRSRSRSRRRTLGRKKRTMQALMGVGGLTALLNGLGDL
ncbi:hypothetical protein P153DRAFT_281041 [Dothidotthia symphoricarpi CBS 119687]|uniref:Fungal N-terminal domain-containing protein n=1 Tax=Dothidotthia symphoricarpi CBS 119687 TaxID=1392245 RepID=A0A6A6ASV5_9PLEO|nr:uncharacterized protein P153DRAFT_281041 [Dothidotthia symphoricarpi CBS 119687]KAF2134303.1 hypothetical protein P153DRAFT_281041 [Dothidotthia symphoricarpi CBS 119687]